MRRPRARSPFLLLLLVATPAGAQQIVTSAAVERVAVTLYRDPGRGPGNAMDPDWLNGFALVSETRRVVLPAGESQLRFEGVAGGILPQSAIVTGLPDGVVERNRDALLLSPESLVDRSLGRRVHLRRTLRETGAVSEQDAVVRSGPDGALVVQTRAGVEALRCTGLAETIRYDGVPAGLSARPTLSVRTRTARPVTATVTLTYLASGFDWQANYVLRLAEDGAHVDLFGWLVLGSNDETSFADADTQAVAGRVNRVEAEDEGDEPAARPLTLTCWPGATTSDIPLEVLQQIAMFGDQGIAGVVAPGAQEIRLQGVTRTEDLINNLPQAFASQEDLGDLKLYRLPGPVTVAANSLKQVAFLERTQIPVEIVYRNNVGVEFDGQEPAGRFVLTRNLGDHQLGVPLPGGQVQIFRHQEGRPLLVGEGDLADNAVGERVEIWVGVAPGVTARASIPPGARPGERLLAVTNDQSSPVRYEARFTVPPQRMRARGVRLDRRDGQLLWQVTVPANGTVALRYRIMAGES